MARKHLNIGGKIQARRKAMGLSQEDLAQLTGVSRQSVTKWETGQSAPDLDRLVEVSDVDSHLNQEMIAESQSNEEYRGMGTTFVAATISDGKVTVMNIGDSRLYYGNQELTQITVDHSYVEELIHAGIMEREEGRFHPKKNVITRALGTVMATPDFFEFDAKDGYLLLCSDGLSNMISDEELKELLLEHSQIANKVNQMITRANEYGGKDNISLVIVDLKR